MADILLFLKENPRKKGWTSREIHDELGIGMSSIGRSLRNLRKTNFVVYKIDTKKNLTNQYVYWYNED